LFADRNIASGRNTQWCYAAKPEDSGG
jgi:hypothetical protein